MASDGSAIVHCRLTDWRKGNRYCQIQRKEYGMKEMGERIEFWRKNKRAGEFQEELDEAYIDKKASLKWLKDGMLGYNDGLSLQPKTKH